MKGGSRGGASKQQDYAKNYLRAKRLEVIKVLGGRCKSCGFSDQRALQIDHINGGGLKERYTGSGGYVGGRGGNYNNEVLKSVQKHENKYQLLCANCNWIKRFDKNENSMRGAMNLGKQSQ